MPSRDYSYDSTNITPNLREIMEIEDGVFTPDFFRMCDADIIAYMEAFDYYDAVKPLDLEVAGEERGIYSKKPRLI